MKKLHLAIKCPKQAFSTVARYKTLEENSTAALLENFHHFHVSLLLLSVLFTVFLVLIYVTLLFILFVI